MNSPAARINIVSIVCFMSLLMCGCSSDAEKDEPRQHISVYEGTFQSVSFQPTQPSAVEDFNLDIFDECNIPYTVTSGHITEEILQSTRTDTFYHLELGVTDAELSQSATSIDVIECVDNIIETYTFVPGRYMVSNGGGQYYDVYIVVTSDVINIEYVSAAGVLDDFKPELLKLTDCKYERRIETGTSETVERPGNDTPETTIRLAASSDNHETIILSGDGIGYTFSPRTGVLTRTIPEREVIGKLTLIKN